MHLPFSVNCWIAASLAVGSGLLSSTCRSAPAAPGGGTSVSVVDRPDASTRNAHYPSNREPLLPSRFVPLPTGSITPGGWLREVLQRQRTGLTGHLGEISAWLQKDDNAWLNADGQGRYGWEELPYWLKGYIELAYTFDDPSMIAECQVWVEGTLASQRDNGDFGPDQRFGDDGTRDYWANMIMLFCLQSYYEATEDARVLGLMTRYFEYQLTVPDEKMLTHYWQKMRGGDNLYSIHWLFNRTGSPELLQVAEKIHRCTANWHLKDDLPNWHNVNISQCFREPAQFYQQSGDEADLQAAYANFREVRKRYGQVPGGMFGSDENCRPGYDDPRQAVETCGMVEHMLSDAVLFHISGDPFWADHCEEVAFNTYPTALMPDFRALRYLTAPNMVVSDSQNHAPGVQNGGPFMMMNPFSSRCCQHNHSHGWPYFNKHLWAATPDNGACAALYSACEVRVKVGDGTTVRIVEDTRYPFEDTVRFTLATEAPVAFPLYLRIPAWCPIPSITVNEGAIETNATGGTFVRLEREWQDGDRVVLTLPMQLNVQRWERNHDSVSIHYGPLTYSLKIGERYDRFDSTKTAVGDSSWQDTADPGRWPSYEIHPTTPWNYGLILDVANPENSFTVKQGVWPADSFPFTLDAAPITIQAKAQRIPEWTIDRYGLCAVLQDSPVLSDQPVEMVTLVPMGCARLRISAFPVVGDGATAQRWTEPQRPAPPLYTVSASHVFDLDVTSAPCDGLSPARSSDHSVPRFTWWDHVGSKEWFQYDFEQPKELSEISVYWFDDTGIGRCRVPASWRLLYRAGGEWKDVEEASAFTTTPDRPNRVTFKPVVTSALRLDVQLKPDMSGGILEWTVGLESDDKN